MYQRNIPRQWLIEWSVILLLLFSVAPAQAATIAITRVVGVENGQTLSGTVYIGVETSGTVDRVEFRLEGPKTATWTEQGAPWWLFGNSRSDRAGWNTTTYPNGDYRLGIAAVTSSGGRETVTISFRVANGTAVPPSGGGQSPFPRPALNNPRTVSLTNADPDFYGNGSEDVIVIVRERLTVPAKIANVRNFVLVGGEFTISRPIPQPDWPGSAPDNNTVIMQHKALSLVNITGVGYLEGIYVNGTNGNMSEGIQIWGSSSGRIVIVNSRIEGVSNARDDTVKANPDAHGDLIQVMAGSLFLHNVTLTGTDYQGLYAQGEYGLTLGEIRLSRVLFADARRQALFINVPAAARDGPILTMTNQVYYRATARAINSPKNTNIMAPRDGQANIVTSSYLRWTEMAPEVLNGATINLGAPPSGDFAPASKVGRSYDAAFFQ